jgi:hypothetical protein
MNRGEQLRWAILVLSALNGGGTSYRGGWRVWRAWKHRNPWHLGGALVWGGLTYILWVFGRTTYRLTIVPNVPLVHDYIYGLAVMVVGGVVLNLGEWRGKIKVPE